MTEPLGGAVDGELITERLKNSAIEGDAIVEAPGTDFQMIEHIVFPKNGWSGQSRGAASGISAFAGRNSRAIGEYSAYCAAMANPDLDRFDRQLLNAVQADAAATSEKLAEIVALSPSAIQRRLRRLRDLGVIVRETAILDARLVGGPTFFVVALEVERERPELLAQLRRWIAVEEQVQQAFYVTGEADFVLIVTAPNTEAYDLLMTRLVSENTNVRRFTTNVALGVVKRGLTIPVPED